MPCDGRSIVNKPKLAILNSSSFGKHFPAQLEAISAVGPVTRVDVPIDVAPEVLVEKLKGVNGIVASVTPRIPGAVMEQLPDLVLIARHGIGCDNVDLEAATNLGILVSKVEGIIEQEALAEHTLTLMLAACRWLPNGHISVREDRWTDRAKYLGLELRHQRIGLVGVGNIGSRVSEILSVGFKAEVVATDPFLSDDEIRRRHATPVALKELFETSDIISFHCPLSGATKRMLNRATFEKLKKGVIIVNTCRGELLDESALCDGLKSGHVRYYATDVVENEPIGSDHRLLQFPNVLVLPHLGGYTNESLSGMGQTMVDDVQNVFVKGTLPGVLANPEILTQEFRKWR